MKYTPHICVFRSASYAQICMYRRNNVNKDAEKDSSFLETDGAILRTFFYLHAPTSNWYSFTTRTANLDTITTKFDVLTEPYFRGRRVI